MTDATPPAEPDVPSPCVGICFITVDGYCAGCFRTRDELQGWWTASNAEKLAILDRCRLRESGEATGSPDRR